MRTGSRSEFYRRHGVYNGWALGDWPCVRSLGLIFHCAIKACTKICTLSSPVHKRVLISPLTPFCFVTFLNLTSDGRLLVQQDYYYWVLPFPPMFKQCRNLAVLQSAYCCYFDLIPEFYGLLVPQTFLRTVSTLDIHIYTCIWYWIVRWAGQFD